MRHLTILLVCISIVFSYSELYAQKADTSWQQQQIHYAKSFSAHEFSGPNSPVYQGYEHIPYSLPVNGDPFYLSKDWQTGSVDFKGEQYDNLPLLYDIYKDELILQSPDKLYRIALSINDVSQFAIDNHTFLRILKSDADNTENLAPGYYELLYAGIDSLLAKRTKIVNVPTQPGMPRIFMEQNAFYIKKDGHYYPVKTKRSVLRVLEDEKGKLAKFIRQNKISYMKERGDAIVKTMQYYDQLKK